MSSIPCLVNSSLKFDIKKKVDPFFLKGGGMANFAFPNLASWNSYDHKCPDDPMVLATE